MPPGQKVTVSYTPPDVNPVQDLAGEEAEGFSRQPATSALPAPAVTAVAVVSDAGGDATYGLGETIRVRVTFNQAVKVDTTDGTPRLNIRMDPRWGTFPAVYESGGGTANLTFAYTVAEPNTAPPGIAVLANTLELNGGTIRSLSGTDAKLAHAGLGHDAKHKVNWRLAPSDVSAVAVVSNAGGDNTYALGETIRVRVTFDGTVSVDTAGGTPRLKIRMDPRWGTFWATYESGGGTNALTFAYTVAEPNTSPPGIAVLANTLQANGGAIRLAATNANARLGHAGLGHNPAHKVDWRLSPPVATHAAGRADRGDGDGRVEHEPLGELDGAGGHRLGGDRGLRAALACRRVGSGECVRLDGDRRRRRGHDGDDRGPGGGHGVPGAGARAGRRQGVLVFERRGPHAGGGRHDAARAGERHGELAHGDGHLRRGPGGGRRGGGPPLRPHGHGRRAAAAPGAGHGVGQDGDDAAGPGRAGAGRPVLHHRLLRRRTAEGRGGQCGGAVQRAGGDKPDAAPALGGRCQGA